MAYRLDFTKKAQEHINFHRKTGNQSLLAKIAVLLDELTEHPFSGTGKPELLKYKFSGMWWIYRSILTPSTGLKFRV